jgi:hypothetical protein
VACKCSNTGRGMFRVIVPKILSRMAWPFALLVGACTGGIPRAPPAATLQAASTEYATLQARLGSKALPRKQGSRLLSLACAALGRFGRAHFGTARPKGVADPAVLRDVVSPAYALEVRPRECRVDGADWSRPRQAATASGLPSSTRERVNAEPRRRRGRWGGHGGV